MISSFKDILYLNPDYVSNKIAYSTYSNRF